MPRWSRGVLVSSFRATRCVGAAVAAATAFRVCHWNESGKAEGRGRGSVARARARAKRREREREREQRTRGEERRGRRSAGGLPHPTPREPGADRRTSPLRRSLGSSL